MITITIYKLLLYFELSDTSSSSATPDKTLPDEPTTSQAKPIVSPAKPIVSPAKPTVSPAKLPVSPEKPVVSVAKPQIPEKKDGSPESTQNDLFGGIGNFQHMDDILNESNKMRKSNKDSTGSKTITSPSKVSRY